MFYQGFISGEMIPSRTISLSVKSGLQSVSLFSHSSPLELGSFDLSDAINAWSVSGSSLSASDLASNLFSVSLLPYLALLYFLSRPETNAPKLGNFGFQFLLVFVFATIPAGIYAKINYNDILANVDWLHGLAESLLTVTNLLIIFGFRARREKRSLESLFESKALPVVFAIFSSIFVAFNYLEPMLISSQFVHLEPVNALSLPTWIIHASSLLEWLVAIQFIFEYSVVSGNPRWKDLAWGMLPSHASGMCACTFHFL